MALERLPRCIVISKQNGLNLRELLIPTNNVSLRARIHEGLLRLAVLEVEEINIPLNEDDVMDINTVVKNNHWPGANDLLLQTWAAAHELAQGETLRPKSSVQLEQWPEGNPDAVHRPEVKKATAKRVPAKQRRRAELPDHGTAPRLRPVQGAVLPDASGSDGGNVGCPS